MKRLAVDLLLVLVAACSSSDRTNQEVLGNGRPTLFAPADAPVAAGSAAASVTAAADAAREHALREEVAIGSEPETASLLLAGDLCAAERYEEALAVVDAACRRRPNAPALAVARIGLLRDLGRRHVALAELQRLVTATGADAIAPQLLWEYAELAWLEGQKTAALDACRQLQQLPADSPWRQTRGSELATMVREIAAAPLPQHLKVRDLLGNLRGAPASADRLRALQDLLRVGSDSRALAVAIAAADICPLVRATAVGAAEVDQPALLELVRIALSDAAAAVRAAAARRAIELPASTAPALLLDAIAAESDATAFAAMHSALRQFTAAGPELPIDGADSAVVRQQLVAAWRSRWAR